ncbi:uncharacterized protein LOC141600938 [Silene latifolia]|uniref:uncharacterized protein LOC141600938 n=1 Tax=Silene latifolia TaxID=37657 RepID=UPI003D77918E
MSDSSETASLYSPFDDPLFLSPTDQPNLVLSSFLFDGTSFLQWQREVVAALLSKNKSGFLSGDCSLPDATDRKYNQWIRCDLLVKRWFLNSIVPGLRENLQFAVSSKSLWTDIVERFGHPNILEVYELKKDLGRITQDNSPLVEYYGKLKNIWENLDHLDPIPSCICGAMNQCSCQMLKRLVDRETQSKLLQLLMGLISGYEHAQTNLLLMEPLPPINKALGLLQKVERQKHLNDQAAEVSVEQAAFASKKRFNSKANKVGTANKRPKEDSDVEYKFCSHCEKAGHTIEECHKLMTCTFCKVKGHIQERCYKYKAFLKGKGKAGAHSSSQANNVDMLTGDQDTEYRDISPLECPPVNQVAQMSQFQATDIADVPSTSSSDLKSSINFAGMPLSSHVFTASLTGFNDHDWIVDTGASDHITSNIKLMHNVKILAKPVYVGLPDGTVKINHVSFCPNKDSLTYCQINATSVPDLALVHSRFGHSSLEKLQHRSIVGRPQQNGRVERMHRHLLEVARTLKIQSNVPIKFWGECVLTATYLINKMPVKLLRWKTPYELLYNELPSYDELRIFGTLCYATMPPTSTDKFSSRARKCPFLGYPCHQKGYKLYDMDKHVIFTSRDVLFKEDIFPYHVVTAKTQSETPYCNQTDFLVIQDEHITSNIPDPVNGNSGGDLAVTDTQTSDILVGTGSATDNINTTDQSLVENNPTDQQVRKSDRPRRPYVLLSDYVLAKPKRGHSTLHVRTINDLTTYDKDFIISLCNVIEEHEPSTYAQASTDARWVQAMNQELQALEDNKTWELTNLPSNKKAIGSKWVFKIKHKADGIVERFKARLVAKGYNQVKDKNYKFTFSPVAKFATVRDLLAVAAVRHWNLYQLDINNAFLHGFLDEEVYMKPPLGYSAAKKGQVCRLKRSLYGLKQASRQWNLELTKHLLSLGFIQSKNDYSLFTKVNQTTQKILVALIYVDDMILSGNDEIGI